MHLSTFSHDRKSSLADSCIALRNAIDSFTNEPMLDRWYTYFARHYRLPKTVVAQTTKVFLENAYNYQKSKFSKAVTYKSTFFSVLKHIGCLVKALINARNLGNYVDARELMIDLVLHKVELERYSKLADLFGRHNVLVIASAPVNLPDFNILFRPYFKYYDQKETYRALVCEIFSGLFLYLSLSRRLKLNLVAIAKQIVGQYLYYFSLFKHYRAKYCIQDRHYQTCAIKNHLFRRFGGKYSTAIQKNIHQLGRNGFYYDTDVLFALGRKTVDRALLFGGRVGKVVPVGSFFMEHYWFEQQALNSNVANFDIVYIGTNVTTGMHYLDAYELFVEDYYDSFQWLIDLAATYPHLRIGIKHHIGNVADKRELTMLKDSRVIRIDQRLNSYEVAFKAHCVVTYGSTMGYELIRHGTKTLFMDPGKRCALLPNQEDDILSSYRVCSYIEFVQKVTQLLSHESLPVASDFNADDLCLDSQNVSNRIYDWFQTEGEVVRDFGQMRLVV